MTDPLDVISQVAGVAAKADAFSTEAAKTSSALWGKVLGPPAEAYGAHLRARIELWSQDRLARRVLDRAAKKVDAEQPGSVPPRVAADVFEKAQWAEDEFLTEYLSGMLASARTSESSDDSAVSWTALVGRMSSAQLRLHYILYAAVRRQFLARKFANGNDLERIPLLVEYTDVVRAARWAHEREQTYTRMLDAIYGLEREGLLHNVGHGGRGFWEATWAPVHRRQLPDGVGYVSFHMTPSGALLFLRAHGMADQWSMALIEPEIQCEFAGSADEKPGDVTVHAWEDLPASP